MSSRCLTVVCSSSIFDIIVDGHPPAGRVTVLAVSTNLSTVCSVVLAVSATLGTRSACSSAKL